MARAYGNDLREKVLAAYAAGKGTLRQLAERFDVSYGWVAKIHAAELATGSRRLVPQRRRPSLIDTEQVRRLVKAKPDIVLRELSQALRESGRPASPAQLWRVLRKMGMRLKKSRSTPPSAIAKPTGTGVKHSSKQSRGSHPKT